jgi:hypothetical protein
VLVVPAALVVLKGVIVIVVSGVFVRLAVLVVFVVLGEPLWFAVVVGTSNVPARGAIYSCRSNTPRTRTKELPGKP